MNKNPLYNRWVNMKQRCYNKENPDYINYGFRGIVVCRVWKNNFKKFEKWAIDNKYKGGLTLDRIDFNGNYEPNNCRWVNNEIQATNKRNIKTYKYKGDFLSLAQICRIEMLDKSKIWHRIFRQGMTLNDAIKIGNGRSKNKKRCDTLKYRCESLGVNYNAVKLRKSRFGITEKEALKFYTNVD